MHDRIKFDDLKLYKRSSVKLDIGIKEDAEYKDRINIFGKNFGDYPQVGYCIILFKIFKRFLTKAPGARGFYRNKI